MIIHSVTSVKDLAASAYSAMVRGKASELNVELTDVSSSLKRDIVTHANVAEALVQQFKLAYSGEGSFSPDDVADMTFQIIFGTNRFPVVSVWRDTLYNQIMQLLNHRIKFTVGSHDPFSEIVARAVSKIQNEMMAILLKKVGLRMYVTKPKNVGGILLERTCKTGKYKYWLHCRGDVGNFEYNKKLKINQKSLKLTV